jgi:hypothetical protein
MGELRMLAFAKVFRFGLTLVACLLSHASNAQLVKTPLPGFVLPKAESDYDQKLLSDLDRVGWHHVHVQEEGDKPGYAFSLGFYANYGQPEVVVFGLPPPVAQKLLNIAAIRAAGARKRYEPFVPYDNIAEGMRVIFVPVSRRFYREYFGYGLWFYQSVSGAFPMLQMVWPDRQGRLPGEPGYDSRYLKVQPVLMD